jgi:distribution and morphology protein 34
LLHRNLWLLRKLLAQSIQPSNTNSSRSGLTIPLQITLSEIQLSAFIILVFSKQKGVTLVFRNDPLESLKVSSTFDLIPFVRNYLQKEIEAQLRVLLMEEVPAIIHRLSLRLWVPEYREQDDAEITSDGPSKKSDEQGIDPFASPSQDPAGQAGDILDISAIPSMSLDPNALGHHSIFSQKNLLKLAALRDSQHTLSLFTPSMKDTVFRAWTGPLGHSHGTNTPITSTLVRTHSANASMSSTYNFQQSTQHDHTVRPSLASHSSAASGLSMSSNRSRNHTGRKKKNRVVNLRRNHSYSDLDSISGESSTSGATTTPASSESPVPKSILEEKEEELVTPPSSPKARVRWSPGGESIDLGDSPPRRRPTTPRRPIMDARSHTDTTLRPPQGLTFDADDLTPRPLPRRSSVSRQNTDLPTQEVSHPKEVPEKKTMASSNSESASKGPQDRKSGASEAHQRSGILEQAWVMKMASDIARRAQEQKASNDDFWGHGNEDLPPPAYEVR